MKKLISFLAVVALIAAFPFGAFADPAVTLKMEGITVEAGTESVTLTLICQSSATVADGQVVITFPADKLELTDAASPIAENAVNTRKAAEGRVQMGFITDTGLGQNATLLTLTFSLRDPQAEAAYTVTASTVRMADPDYHNLVDPKSPVTAEAAVTVVPKQAQPDPEVERLKKELSDLIGQEIDEEAYTEDSLAAYNGLVQQASSLVQDAAATAPALQQLIDQLQSALVEKPAETVLLGDVDGDGRITSTDARLVLQLSVNKIRETDLTVPAAADVDKDGKVTSTDARLILQFSVGKIPGFDAL